MKRVVKKKINTKTLKNKLWELCKEITRKRYGPFCYTCGRGPLVGPNWHTGHFIAKAACSAILKYELKNLRPQCYDCNINKGGMGAVFYRNLLKNEGQEYVDELFRMKEVIIDADNDWYEGMIEAYTKLLKNTKLMVSSNALDKMSF